MTKLLLVRHCKAHGQEPDAPLTNLGYEQAQALGHFLAAQGVQRTISSPYRRATESAEPLAAQLKLPIEFDERLIERRLGRFEGEDWQSALKASFDDLSLCLPDGEWSMAAGQRGRSVIDEVLSAGVFKTAVFTHGNLLTLCLNSFDPAFGFDFWKELENPDVIAFDDVDGMPRIEKMIRRQECR